MAVIKQGILGGFSNKCGSVVGTSWKGIAVMKAKPLSVANPRTAAQVKNRNRQTMVLELAQGIGTGFIRTYWNRFAKNMSGFNDFMSRNANCIDTSTMSYKVADIVTSDGTLKQQSIVAIQPISGNQFTVTFNARSQSSDYLVGDVSDLVVFNITKNQFAVNSDIAATVSSTNVVLPSGWVSGNQVACYLSTRRASGIAVSKSFFKLGSI